MAVTKIWPVKDSLSRLIEYAENPEKTAFESLETVMAYAGDEDKVIYEKGEKCYLVTALNCRGNALESMIKVQKHFGAKGENIAYHAYQSFKPGEVTPEQCHEIGVKLAEKLWGNRYQVLVATHTNCCHLHNHYVISAVSFRDGKKLDTGNNYWGRVLSPASDALCREYGLSTLGKRRKAAPRVLYMDEKKGNAKRASTHLCAAQARKRRERVQGGYVVVRLHSSVAVGYRKDGKTHDLQLLLEYGDEEDSAVF